MSDRIFYATDDDSSVIFTFHYQSGLNSDLIRQIKHYCTRIFIDAMGNDAPSDWSYSNPKMKEWLKSQGLTLPVFALSDDNDERLNDALWDCFDTRKAVSRFSKPKCVYGKNTKQFSEKPTTEENTSKVVGQIIKHQGKTFFQIIAMTEDMELAGKTKNSLLKMGYTDGKEEVKQFGIKQHADIVVVDPKDADKFLNIDGDFVDFRKGPADEFCYFETVKEAEKKAKEVGGKVRQFANFSKYDARVSVRYDEDGNTFYEFEDDIGGVRKIENKNIESVIGALMLIGYKFKDSHKEFKSAKEVMTCLDKTGNDIYGYQTSEPDYEDWSK